MKVEASHSYANLNYFSQISSNKDNLPSSSIFQPVYSYLFAQSSKLFIFKFSYYLHHFYSLCLLALFSLSELLLSHLVHIGRLIHELTVEELEDSSEKAKDGHEADDSRASAHVFDVDEGNLSLSERLALFLLRLPLQVVRVLFDFVRHHDLLRRHFDLLSALSLDRPVWV